MDIFVRFRPNKGAVEKRSWIRGLSSCETKGYVGNGQCWLLIWYKAPQCWSFLCICLVVWFCICLYFGFVFVLYFLAGCALVLSAAVVLVSLASWRRRRGLTFAADPQIRTTGSTLHSAAQPKKNCPPSFFCQKLASDIFWAMASVSKANFSTSISGVSDCWCDQKSKDINLSAIYFHPIKPIWSAWMCFFIEFFVRWNKCIGHISVKWHGECDGVTLAPRAASPRWKS